MIYRRIGIGFGSKFLNVHKNIEMYIISIWQIINRITHILSFYYVFALAFENSFIIHNNKI